MQKSSRLHPERHAIAYLLAVLLAGSLFGCVPPVTPAAAPSVAVGPLTQQATDVVTEFVDQNNCGGTIAVTNEVRRSRAIRREMSTEGEFSVSASGEIGILGTGVELGAQVAARLGFTYGTEETIERTISVGAAPGTHMQHQIVQQEIWQAGQALVTLGQISQTVDFRFRTDFGVNLVDSIQIPCATLTSFPPTDTPVPPTATDMATATSTPSPSATSTVGATPTALDTATPTSTSLPSPTETSPPPSDTPIPTHTPGCTTEGVFRTIWEEYKTELGCNLGQAQIGSITTEAFQGGYLVWIKADDRIYAVRHSGMWSSHPNTWTPGEESLPCDAAKSYGYPAMGFGKLWCNDAAINSSLRAPIDREQPADNAQRQFFENGQIFRAYNGLTIILLNNGISWIVE